LKKGLQLVEDAVTPCNQGGTRLGGGGVHLFLARIRKGDDGNMRGLGMAFEFAKDGADIHSAESQIDKENEGLFLPRNGEDRVGVGAALDTVAEVAQVVEQLGSGQGLFIQHERQRLHHAGRLGWVRPKSKGWGWIVIVPIWTGWHRCCKLPMSLGVGDRLDGAVKRALAFQSGFSQGAPDTNPL
jgi:hypothetical protein